MTSRKQHPAELRERAVAMVFELRAASGSSRGTLASVGHKLGVNPETLRNWVEKAEIDSGQRPGTTSDDKKRIAGLEKAARGRRRERRSHRVQSGTRKIKIIQPERSWYLPRTRMLRGTHLAALVNTMDPEPILDGSRSPVARSAHPEIEPNPLTSCPRGPSRPVPRRSARPGCCR